MSTNNYANKLFSEDAGVISQNGLSESSDGTVQAPKQTNKFTIDLFDDTASATGFIERNVSNVETALPDMTIYLPQWGYRDYFVERLNWQKGLTSVGDEPGWFYFKIFFHFNTPNGLLGGIVEDEKLKRVPGANCADKYFEMWKGHYKPDNLGERQKALRYFVTCLNKIANDAPWFFQSVTGLDKASVSNLNEVSTKDNKLEIKCMEESIDMRLTTLFDYYKFACFDYINYKEILPENLRKFDMSIVLFGVPIRYLDTRSKLNGKDYDIRKLRPDGSKGQAMTFKMFTFKNCEFDLSGGNNPFMINEVTNANPFQLNSGSFKIKFDRVFNYNQNGFFGTSVSDFGFDDKLGTDMEERFSSLADAFNVLKFSYGVQNDIDNLVPPKTKFSKFYKNMQGMGAGSAYKALIDETEAICQDYYNNVANNMFNNFVANKMGASDIGYITPPEKAINTDYYKKKLKELHRGKNL